MGYNKLLFDEDNEYEQKRMKEFMELLDPGEKERKKFEEELKVTNPKMHQDTMSIQESREEKEAYIKSKTKEDLRKEKVIDAVAGTAAFVTKTAIRLFLGANDPNIGMYPGKRRRMEIEAQREAKRKAYKNRFED